MAGCDLGASVADEASEVILPYLSLDGFVAQILEGHSLAMREAIDMEYEQFWLVDDGCLLQHVLFLAFAAGKAFEFTLCLKIKGLVVSETMDVCKFVSLFGPPFPAAFADVSTGGFDLEELLKISKA